MNSSLILQILADAAPQSSGRIQKNNRARSSAEFIVKTASQNSSNARRRRREPVSAAETYSTSARASLGNFSTSANFADRNVNTLGDASIRNGTIKPKSKKMKSMSCQYPTRTLSAAFTPGDAMMSPEWKSRRSRNESLDRYSTKQ